MRIRRALVQAAAWALLLTVPLQPSLSQSNAVQASSQSLQALQGHWVGTLERGGTKAAIQLHLQMNGDEITGTFDWPDLGYRGADLLGARVADGTTRVGIPLPLGSLRLIGTTSGNHFRGQLEETTRRANEWVTLPRDGSFDLRRSKPSPPPYTIAPVRFGNGDVTLAGEVYVPRGKGSRPGVVFIHGSGDSNRADGAFYADRLARSGIAVLVYDKRGVGDSSGSWKTGSYQDLAGDAHKAMLALKATTGVDSRRVGYIARSEGGWVAPLAVGMGGAAFLGVISGPTISVADEDIDHYRVALREGGFGEEELAKAFALLRLRHSNIAGKLPKSALDSALNEARNAPWFARLNWDEAEDKSTQTFRARTIGFDPAEPLRKLGVPSLWLYGTDDKIIPAADSIARLIALQIEPRPTITVLPRADHALAVVDYPRLPSGVSEAAGLLTNWIKRVTQTPVTGQIADKH